MHYLSGMVRALCGRNTIFVANQVRMFWLVRTAIEGSTTNARQSKVSPTAQRWYTLFNPVGNNYSKYAHCKFNGDELTSGGVLGSLCRPDRSDGVQDPSPNTVEDTSYYHLADRKDRVKYHQVPQIIHALS